MASEESLVIAGSRPDDDAEDQMAPGLVRGVTGTAGMTSSSGSLGP